MKMFVTVYVKPGCVECKKTMKTLDARQIPYYDYDVTQDKRAADRLKRRGFNTFPVVDVKSKMVERAWSGHSEYEIDHLAKEYHKGDERVRNTRFDRVDKTHKF